MPVPQDDTLPSDKRAEGSTSSTTVEGADTENIIEKFQQLGQDAADEENEGDDDDDEDEAGEVGQAGASVGEGGEGAGAADKKKKKKKKKGKASKAVDRLKTITTGSAPQELVDMIRQNMDTQDQSAATDEEIRKALKAADLMKMLDGQKALGNKVGTKALGEHKFWKTQPVPQLPSAGSSSAPLEEGPIDELKHVKDVKQEPGALPSGFEWSLIDVKNDDQCREVHQLLTENYVEDDDAMFRFQYSKEFLLWALTPPGYSPDWHIGVRVAKTGKLIAFISGIKLDIRVRSRSFPAAEVNFLCVHKKLRSKRLAPVLIKEVTRRVNLQNVWQAIYTGGVVIPTPIGTSRYYHRNLNPQKLVDIGFSAQPRSMTMTRMKKHYSVGTVPRTPGFRELTKADIPQVRELLTRFLDRYDVAQLFTKDEEVEHWFLSGQGKEVDGKRVEQVVWAYVVEDPTTHLITDFISFYSLPSSIMKSPKHDTLNAAYLFYYASDAIFSPGGSSDDAARHEAKAKSKLGERLNALSNDMLVVAQNVAMVSASRKEGSKLIQQAGFDVVNALTCLDNNMFLTEQKFGAGDGYLNYYLYNWACGAVDGGQRTTATKEGSGLGVVML